MLASVDQELTAIMEEFFEPGLGVPMQGGYRPSQTFCSFSRPNSAADGFLSTLEWNSKTWWLGFLGHPLGEQSWPRLVAILEDGD